MSEPEARAEVERQHRVLEGWLSGSLPRTAFGEFADAHEPEFTLVGADGVVLGREELLAAVERGYGAAPDLRIAVSEVRLVAEAGPVLVVTFLERHEGAGGRARRATAVLVRAPGGGLRWRHLQETWVAGQRWNTA
ncbi:hypothetical protein SAMN05421810_101363 [Amycolatopsis arida]|uniref:DUF4440 domain-containing protein n=1 Tax=Amycolatopsis arida TaxID=587909 RepID=A0A1I5L0W9_9PSEU|nr:DUF4440 domain-containing protein [Amycolatopsis arida]TDX85907.1 hypothetical protein CLV69_11488 [Amycolatopsis arida]SFO90980.1 hypothetical protein SAMN05421810_101363 [Amycolatopsis arida]